MNWRIGFCFIGINKLSPWVGVGGWVAGSNEFKSKSAQFQVKLPTGAELGKIKQSIKFTSHLKVKLTQI